MDQHGPGDAVPARQAECAGKRVAPSPPARGNGEKRKPPKYYLDLHLKSKAAELIAKQLAAKPGVMPTVTWAEMVKIGASHGIKKEFISMTLWALNKVGIIKRVSRGVYTKGE